MSAESVRLNTTSSNLANANSVSSASNETYKARHPVFSALLDQSIQAQSVPVEVMGIIESNKPLVKEHHPAHPMADDQGYIYKPNVNVMEEMANMISASQAYQMHTQVAETNKQLLLQTLRMGKG